MAEGLREPLLHGFPPVGAGKEASVLILGSMPGAESLRQGMYYAHPRNLFWPIMGELVGARSVQPYPERVEALGRSGIVLWDVLQACIRRGSLDSAIREEMPNDFLSFFRTHPFLRSVFFNGAKAEQAFTRHVIPFIGASDLMFRRLPSTSPAYAGMKYADKLAAWRVVCADLSART